MGFFSFKHELQPIQSDKIHFQISICSVTVWSYDGAAPLEFQLSQHLHGHVDGNLGIWQSVQTYSRLHCPIIKWLHLWPSQPVSPENQWGRWQERLQVAKVSLPHLCTLSKPLLCSCHASYARTLSDLALSPSHPQATPHPFTHSIILSLACASQTPLAPSPTCTPARSLSQLAAANYLPGSLALELPASFPIDFTCGKLAGSCLA